MAEAESPVEVVAKTMWKLGNERVGFREWDAVGDVYLAEAREVVAALREIEALYPEWLEAAVRQQRETRRRVDP